MALTGEGILATLQKAGPVSTVLSASIIVFVAIFIGFIANQPKRLKFPVIDVPPAETSGWKEALAAGSRQYPNTPFILPEKTPLVILPQSVIDEVRNLPDHKASLDQETDSAFGAQHTGVGKTHKVFIRSIQTDLQRNIASATDALQDEIEYAVESEFGPCDEWTPIQLYSKVARVVALLSGKVFVGTPLSREQEWIESSINYSIDMMNVHSALLKYPRSVHFIVAPFLREVARLKEYYVRGAKFLKPLVEACVHSASKKEKVFIDDSEDQQGTLLSWMIGYMDPKARIDPSFMAQLQMYGTSVLPLPSVTKADEFQATFAAIHTTTISFCNAVYDLLARPEYIPILKAELEEVFSEDGYDLDSRVKIKSKSFAKFKKMDSFLKESQRRTPPGLYSLTRIATSDLKLSSGHTIPKGTRFAFNSWLAHQDGPAANSNSQAPANEFDGLRFYKLRAIPGNEAKYQYTSASPESMGFGYGNHACPGRFFANNEMKSILIELLRYWDFRFADKDLKGRPDSLEFGTRIIPIQ